MRKVLRHLGGMLLALAVILPALTACSDDNDLGELPGKIQSFLGQYYPGNPVSDYVFTDNEYRVTMKNGNYLVFDSSMNWTTIDGRGGTVPEYLMYDEFPEALYEYLQTTGTLSEVRAVSRTSAAYTVTLTDQTVIYDIASGMVR